MVAVSRAKCKLSAMRSRSIQKCRFLCGTTTLLVSIFMPIRTFSWIQPVSIRRALSKGYLSARSLCRMENNSSTGCFSPFSENTHDKTNPQRSDTKPKLTNCLLQISYDGSFFSGWSSGKASLNDLNTPAASSNETPSPSRRRRRQSNNIYSVQHVMQANLAKLYGNVDPSRIIVEGCSRTDKGVHATGMVAQIYCLKQTEIPAKDASLLLCDQPAIPGRRLPHPWNTTDMSYFEPVPMDLSRLAFALNRMYFNVQVVAVAETPQVTTPLPFHPTLSSYNKTYRYYFSVGSLPDPIQKDVVWHLGPCTCSSLKDWTTRLLEACVSLQGQHNFAAFRGAPRGADDKQKYLNQDTCCTIDSITLHETATWLYTTTYTLEITGNRFLYKMVRFLVGAVVAVAQGKLSVADLKQLLETGSRKECDDFECAPAHGLVLCHVDYGDILIDWKNASS